MLTDSVTETQNWDWIYSVIDNLFVHYYKVNIEHPNGQIRWCFRFQNNNSCVFSIRKFELHGNQFTLTETVTLKHRLIHQEPILRCKQVWIKWEQLRCIAHSILIIAITRAFFSLLGRCTVRAKRVPGNFACTKTLKSLGRSDYKCPQCAYIYIRSAIFYWKNKHIRFNLCVAKEFIILKRRKNQFKILLEMSIYLAGNVQDKSVSMSIHGKRMVKTVTKVCNAKRASTFWTIQLRTTNRQLCCLAVMAQIALSKRRVVTMKKKNHLYFWKYFSAHHNQLHQNLCQKRQKSFHLWHICADFPLVDTVNQKFISILILYSFTLR